MVRVNTLPFRLLAAEHGAHGAAARDGLADKGGWWPAPRVDGSGRCVEPPAGDAPDVAAAKGLTALYPARWQ